jgi:hypothetical protein
MFKWIKNQIQKLKDWYAFKKRMRELKKRDPFIYK